MVEEPRAGFHVPEWGVFCHTKRLRNRPPRLKLVLSDSAAFCHPATLIGRPARLNRFCSDSSCSDAFTSVDDERVSSHERRHVRGEEQDCIGHFFSCAPPPHRDGS